MKSEKGRSLIPLFLITFLMIMLVMFIHLQMSIYKITKYAYSKINNKKNGEKIDMYTLFKSDIVVFTENNSYFKKISNNKIILEGIKNENNKNN